MIQPFKVFEGLLKPRDVGSRQEKEKLHSDTVLKNAIEVSDTHGKDIVKLLQHTIESIKWNYSIDAKNANKEIHVKGIFYTEQPDEDDEGRIKHEINVYISINTNKTYNCKVDADSRMYSLTSKEFLDYMLGVVDNLENDLSTDGHVFI